MKFLEGIKDKIVPLLIIFSALIYFDAFHKISYLLKNPFLNIEDTLNISRRMFTYADWQMLFYMFFMLSILLFFRIMRSNLKWLLLILLADILMIFILNSSGGQLSFYLKDGTSIQRFIMHFIFAMMFFVALLCKKGLIEELNTLGVLWSSSRQPLNFKERSPLDLLR